MKILFVDIESSDLAADIGHIICIGYKWANEPKAHVMSILDYPGKFANDDKLLLKAFEKVYNQADIVVHHFGEYFDIPFLQTRRLIHGLHPMPETTMVDTWRICKKRLKFGSNRLQRVLEVLGCPIEKTPVKLSVWSLARLGHKKSIDYVIDHCLKDILVLEWVYNKIKSVWTPHPALVINSDDKYCRFCKEYSGISNGFRPAKTHVYRRMGCKKCGFSWKGAKIGKSNE